MITSEKLLKIISAIVLISTISFTVITVTVELLKPKEKLSRIISSDCENKFTTLEKIVENETSLTAIQTGCVFIPSELLVKSEFLNLISKMGNLKYYNYLFIGKKGILLKKAENDHKAAAEKLHKCLKKNECNEKDTEEILTVTILLKKFNGEKEISVSFVDTELSQIIKNSKKLSVDIAKLRETEINNLKLILIFHNSYTFIEDKSSENAVSLMKKGLDGIYLESRGAKIRVLPDEYAGTDPLILLDKKGKQYGLDKDEYKKDEATVYIYRTTQYIETNNEMVLFSGNSTFNKSSYSDRLSTLLLSKHLKNIQEPSGRFFSGIEISSGKTSDEKDSLVSQCYASLSLFKSSIVLDDMSLMESAKKSLTYIIQNAKSNEIKAFVIGLISFCGGNCSENIFYDTLVNYSKDFQDIAKVNEMIESQPVYTGLFINAASVAKKSTGFESELISALETSKNNYKNMQPFDKIRFISFISEINPSIGPELGKIVKNFVVGEEKFLKSLAFDHAGFDDLKGSISIKKDPEKPDTALTIILANGLSSAVNNGFSNQAVSQIESDNGNFIRHLIVTDDDFPVWNSAIIKPKVQGGVKSFPESKNVKLSNSARALNYFVNRISGKRER